MKRIILLAATLAATLLFVGKAHATRFKGLQAIDKETLVVQFQDGDVRYRDNGTGPSAFLGHTFVDGDDTLVVFHPRLDPSATGWTVTSADDPDFGTVSVTPCRKSKPMHWDHTLTAELDHEGFLVVGLEALDAGGLGFPDKKEGRREGGGKQDDSFHCLDRLMSLR